MGLGQHGKKKSQPLARHDFVVESMDAIYSGLSSSARRSGRKDPDEPGRQGIYRCFVRGHDPVENRAAFEFDVR